MKIKTLILTFGILSILFLSCNQNKDPEQLIVGTWKIDTIYFENADEGLKIFADKVVEYYSDKLKAAQDSLKLIEQNGLKDLKDSLIFIGLTNEINFYNNIINIYSDPNKVKQVFEASFKRAIGYELTFNSDNTLSYPDTTLTANWKIQNDKLILSLDNESNILTIKKLTKDKLIYVAEQPLDTNLTITIVYELSKTEK